jgi:hypothetical protein
MDTDICLHCSQNINENEVFMNNRTRFHDIVYYYNITTLRRRIRLKL